MPRMILVLPILLLPSLLLGQPTPTTRSWNQPVEPFRIAANLYYVGASDITSFLLTSPEGHIVLDGGFEETAPQILRNIEALGFRPADVRILLSSHAHFDHAGGLALLKRATGARLLASAKDIPLLARGGLDDPQFGDRYPFPPVHADAIVRDGERVKVGPIEMTARITAGHTPGCTTWTSRLRESGRSLDVVFLCSPSVPSEYRLVGNPRYPDAVADYRAQFRFLRSLNPDIPLASHGNFFGLEEKTKLLRSGAETNPFIDPDRYRRLVEAAEERFESMVRRQSSGGEGR